MIYEKEEYLMRNLITYIEEAHETIGKLPFTREQFKDFIAAVDDCDDESPAWTAVEKAVIDKYGEKVTFLL